MDRAGVEAAAARIAGHVRRTPVLEVDPADFGLSGFEMVLKLEFLQHSGSFKARGAFNTLLSSDLPGAGVVAASGGNHGAAVAYAAGKLGVTARIFVPSVSSRAKVDRIRSYGAELTVGGDRYADALAASETCVAETGALPLHAYDAEATLGGQGTVAKEFAEQASPDVILVATGGGGLIGGMAAWAEGAPRIVSVEPETAPTLHDAMAAGRIVDAPAGGYAADSLAPKQVGALMFPIAQRFVEAAVLVPDAAILEAQKRLWDVCRIVVEPGGAAALAALVTGAYRPAAGERVGVLLCGANVSAVSFPETV